MKKVISNIIEGAGELLKDSAKQVAETVDPVKMMENALGIKKNNPPAGGEFSDYLKNLGGNLSESDLEKKKKEFEVGKAKEMEEAQKIIRQSLPDHLKPRISAGEPSIFEKKGQEEEMKKAQMVEAQKKQPKNISAPMGKVTGILGKRRKPQSSGFESSKNIKIG